MKKLLLLMLAVLVLGACNQNAQQPNTPEETKTTDQTDSTKTSTEDKDTTEEVIEEDKEEVSETTQSPGPSEIYTQLESKMKERLFGAYIPTIDYRDSLNDFSLLNIITRNFTDEVPLIGQGEVLNSYYEWYLPEDLTNALVKHYEFTIDFEKYRNANEQEYADIYFDGDFVYLMSADFPGVYGLEEPIINSIKQLPELPVYYVELQYQYIHFYELEEAGIDWDFSLMELPLNSWPEEYQEFIKLDETIIHALFIDKNEFFTLSYYSSIPLSADEQIEYVNGLEQFK